MRERGLDIDAALGAHAQRLRPYVERIVEVVRAAGGEVIDIWPEFGAPEVRFRLPAGASDEEYRRTRRAIVAIQQEVPGG